MKANQKGRICHTPISHWLIYIGYVGFEFMLQITFGAETVHYTGISHLTRSIPQIYYGVGPQGIHTIGVASSLCFCLSPLCCVERKLGRAQKTRLDVFLASVYRYIPLFSKKKRRKILSN